MSDEQHEDAPHVLAAVASSLTDLSGIIDQADPSLKSRVFNSKNVTAHHAIIPTQKAVDFSQLSNAEQKIYTLAARLYVAQFLPKYTYREMTVTLDILTHQFKATSKAQLSPGWRILVDTANDEGDDENEDCTTALDWLSELSALTSERGEALAKKTNPPPLYTMATLLKDLTRVAKYVSDPAIRKILVDKDKHSKDESGGIGTPATRAAIIDGLFKRGFIIEKSKKIISTELGQEFFDLLPEKATAPDMTALWHEQQEQIKSGQMTMLDFVNGVKTYVASEVEKIKKDGIKVKAAQGELCPTCPDKRGKPDFKVKKVTTVSTEYRCPDCDKGLIRRKGKKRNTHFWGCSGFPVCKYSTFDNRGKPKL